MKRAAVTSPPRHFKNLKTNELKSECVRLGLGHNGNRAKLIQRLERPKTKTHGQNAHPSPLSRTTDEKIHGDSDISFSPAKVKQLQYLSSRTEVRIRLTIKDLLDIDIRDHSFKIKFSLEVSWEVPENELSLYESDLTDESAESIVPLTQRSVSMSSSSSAPEIPYSRNAWESKVQFPPDLSPRGNLPLRWTPRLVFSNCLELAKDFEFYEEFERDEVSKEKFVDTNRRPVIVYRLRALGRFQERFELARFPLDAQDLQVGVVAKRTESHIKLIKNPNEKKYRSVVPVEKFMINEEYELSKAVVAIESQTDASESSIRGRVYPKLTFSMKAMRKPSFYTWSIVVPMFLYVVVAFPAVLLPIADLNGRLSIVMTILVASVTHSNQVLSGNIPKMSYLTYLDKYVNVCNFMLLVVTLESTATYLILKFFLDDDDGDPPAKAEVEKARRELDRFEDWASLYALVVWTLCHVLYAGWCWMSFTQSGASNSMTELEREGKVNYRDEEGKAEASENGTAVVSDSTSWSGEFDE